MTKHHSLINKSSALLLSLTTILVPTAYSSLQAQETEGNTTIEEITEPENSEEESVAVGEDVTVRGEVEEVEPGVSFVLQEEGLFEGDEVLVINVSGQTLPETPSDDMNLQVTGEVATLVLADVERDYSLDLDPELYVEYESQPVILARSMVLSPEIEEVSENPDSYYSQEIAIEGEVGEVKNDYAFTLKENELISDDNLLIINASGEPIPTEDETVVVTGTVRPYIQAEFEEDYDLTWDLDVQKEIEAEYTEKPVLVIDSIYPSAQSSGLLD